MVARAHCRERKQAAGKEKQALAVSARTQKGEHELMLETELETLLVSARKNKYVNLSHAWRQS